MGTDVPSSLACIHRLSQRETTSLTHAPASVLQGTPEFVAVSQCVHYFEWKTYAACRKDKFKPHKEVCGGTSDGWLTHTFTTLLFRRKKFSLQRKRKEPHFITAQKNRNYEM